ncbi:BTB/POZ domain-containing protein At3g05675 isoform X2 [Magnolia sinica]|uniref:BTB/POZ domain-containing protein At3g05675 isoform X2 n=1 Tax=Magnolia sinica TaxID=86752 RepID=UPI00265A6459|nr:BTB/POZ domain-containing protein At3g05675 isoform X2 [Magnolia sinica]XP_058107972.1 BTB/POZ domain-containing protein At3g05675 isoform X2 [Magnolia sinica]
MDNSPNEIGDRSTSDVVVRLRTHEGRDDWFYCHSHVLVEKSKYFAERLSEDWPTCQILDSRNCVEVYCQESDFDHHVSALRLLYIPDDSMPNTWHGVKTTLGIIQVAVQLGCPQMVRACVDYLEAVPWEEAEEEEILRIIPALGSQAEPILARLQPVDPTAIVRIFFSAIHFATSSPPPSMNDLKSSAQEQLEYMLTEDDDAPLLTADDRIKSEVRKCVNSLLTRFYSELETLVSGPEDLEPVMEGKQMLQSLLSDLAWACQILIKLEMMKDFVHSWVEMSDKIVEAVDDGSLNFDALEKKLKVIEVAAKVLEVIGYGNVILPTARRLHMVKVWLPFVRRTKPMLDSDGFDGVDRPSFKMDSELWQSIESAFISIVLALPSGDQAQILADWLSGENVHFPDLTEAFEVWCYRSKVAKRRMAALRGGRSGFEPMSSSSEGNSVYTTAILL